MRNKEGYGQVAMKLTLNLFDVALEYFREEIKNETLDK